MPHVDRWVVQSVLSALGRGGLKLPPGRSVAINIAGQTLGDAEFLEFVVDCFDHTGAHPERHLLRGHGKLGGLRISIMHSASSGCCMAWAANSRSMISAAA